MRSAERHAAPYGFYDFLKRASRAPRYLGLHTNNRPMHNRCHGRPEGQEGFAPGIWAYLATFSTCII